MNQGAAWQGLAGRGRAWLGVAGHGTARQGFFMSSYIATNATDPIFVARSSAPVLWAEFVLPDGTRIRYRPTPDPRASFVPIGQTCFRGGNDG